MVKVKVGENATASLNVDVQYRCSSCGNENLAMETIKSTAHTATILGINLDRDIAGEAKNDLENKLNTVLDQKNPRRFRTLGLACTCKQCGHAEPWARMNYDKLDGINGVSLCFLITAGVISSIVMSGESIYDMEINFAHIILCAIVVASLAVCIGISAYKNKNNQKMEELISRLPQEALPRISLHSQERHNGFKKSTATAGTYDKWVCVECGTENSTKYGQCKKCGKYKSS